MIRANRTKTNAVILSTFGNKTLMIQIINMYNDFFKSWMSLINRIKEFYAMYYTIDVPGNMGSRVQSTVRCFPLYFVQFSVAQVLVNNFVYPTWTCAAGFNNYN